MLLLSNEKVHMVIRQLVELDSVIFKIGTVGDQAAAFSCLQYKMPASRSAARQMTAMTRPAMATGPSETEASFIQKLNGKMFGKTKH